LFTLLGLVGLSQDAFTQTIESTSHAPFNGPKIDRAGEPIIPNDDARPYVTIGNLAYQGGSALPAIVKDSFGSFPLIHDPEYLNDGLYGNGASWVPGGSNSWLKIDLGEEILIDSLSFGRDRLDNFDDRDPGQFTIQVATSDVYENANSDNDSTDYNTIVDSSLLMFDGFIDGDETLQVNFSPVIARYLKMNFVDSFILIDEIQVSIGTCSPPPSGNWVVDTSCTMTSDAAINNGDLIVLNNSVLAIPFTLDIDFSSQKIIVESGSGILILSGGSIT